MSEAAIIQQLQFYVKLMIIEGLLYGLYVYGCVKSRNTNHRLFYASVACFIILVGETLRAGGILLGVLHFHPKDILVFVVELIPFSIVAYEIIKSSWQTVQYEVWKIWIEGV